MSLRPPSVENPTVHQGNDPSRCRAGCAYRAGRYLLQEELGRGGMATVWQALDPDLDRSLAVKLMHPDGDVRRFLEEAQITGQLQHPGIPPVHELGKLPDGQPFLAMKLIRGQTLARLLDQRPSPSHDLPRFLAVFEQVCQAVAYAHSKGVIHRDLKPANIMVGAFGEVQVMDWGLAKRVQKVQALPVDGTAAVAPSGFCVVHSGLTQAGSVLGTPAYMSPEQARGETDNLDPRCDVFALGVILAEVLTGPLPHPGSESAVVMLRSLGLDVTALRGELEASGADEELVRLALTCLSNDPERRPADAGAVARAVDAHLAGVRERLRQAELDRARVEVRSQEECKRRRLTLGLAAAVVLLVAGAGAAAWWNERENSRRQAEAQEQALRQRERARLQVKALIEQGLRLRERALWRQALEALDEASRLIEADGAGEQGREVEQVRQGVRLLAELDRIRQDAGLVVASGLNERQTIRHYEKALRGAGIDVQGGALDEVVTAVRRSPVPAGVVAALDDWARIEPAADRQARLWRVTSAVTGEVWREHLAGAMGSNEKGATRRAIEAARGKVQSPHALACLGPMLEALGGEGLAWLRDGCLAHPGDFWLNFMTANVLYWRLRRPEQAAAYYRAALSARPDSVAALSNLGRTLQEHGDLAGALAAVRRALVLDPKLAETHCNLGSILFLQGDLAGALAAFDQALTLEPRLAGAHTNRGLVLKARGDLAGALAAHDRAIALEPKMARAHNHRGQVLRARGDLAGALLSLRRAVELDERDGTAWGNLGGVLHSLGDLEGAEAAARKAVDRSPHQPGWLVNLGNALSAQGKTAEALAVYRRVLGRWPQLAQARLALALALLEQDEFAEASRELEAGLAALPAGHPLHRVMAPHRAELRKLLRLEERLPELLAGKEQPAGPEEALELARCLARRRPVEALRRYAEVFRARPDLAGRLAKKYRFRAACTAARAPAPGDERERAKWQALALTWLRQDLAAWEKCVNVAPARPALLQTLSAWRHAPELAPLREGKGLDETQRRAWGELWAGVDRVMRNVAGSFRRG